MGDRDEEDDVEAVARYNLKVFRALGAELLHRPDQAVELAQALVTIRYGAEQARKQAPFVAADLGDRWKVSATHFSDAMPFFKTRTIVFLDKQTGNLMGWADESDQTIGSH